MTIQGIAQWITVEGNDCANPILLMVHGGPGNPNTPYSHGIYGDWAQRFTVVQWDQRGAGKTYAANPDTREAPLTLDLLTNDGIEVARYITGHLGQKRVVLMGGSWGSALAVSMAQREPDLFAAYVGTAQLVSYNDNLAASSRRILALAEQAGDTATVQTLKTLGPPPWTNPRGFGQLRRAARKYEALRTDAPPKTWWVPAAGYDTPEYEADYTAGEDFSYVQFVGMAGDGMGPKLDVRTAGTTFAMPVYLLQGEEDLTTTPEISRAYYDSLSAPKKDYLPLPRTGHDPNATMVQAQWKVLSERVLPDLPKP